LVGVYFAGETCYHVALIYSKKTWSSVLKGTRILSKGVEEIGPDINVWETFYIHSSINHKEEDFMTRVFCYKSFKSKAVINLRLLEEGSSNGKLNS
jgi:hypothetical protein